MKQKWKATKGKSSRIFLLLMIQRKMPPLKTACHVRFATRSARKNSAPEKVLTADSSSILRARKTSTRNTAHTSSKSGKRTSCRRPQKASAPPATHIFRTQRFAPRATRSIRDRWGPSAKISDYSRSKFPFSSGSTAATPTKIAANRATCPKFRKTPPYLEFLAYFGAVFVNTLL